MAQEGNFRDHGVAVPRSRARGVAATVDGAGKPILLIWLADHRGTRSLLLVDAVTGTSESFPVPNTKGDSPYAFLLSSRNRLYAHFDNQFIEFDPAARAFTCIRPSQGYTAMWLTEDAQGRVWSATYPKCMLTCWDPATQTLTDRGELNRETWPQYPRSLAVDASGWVYVGSGNVTSLLVGFDPATGEIRKLGDPADRKPGAGIVFLGRDGVVYGAPHSSGPWQAWREGKGTPIEGRPTVAQAPIGHGSQESVIAAFPDGRRVTHIDVPGKWAEIRTPETGEVKRVRFDYESEGAHLLGVVNGPDGRLYGSSGHPLYIYAFDPKTGAFESFPLTGENGHLNAMVTARGKLYGALYGGGILWEYDPAQPWDYAPGRAVNPRRLADGSSVIGRPHALIAHPDGRHLVMTGTPGYGLTGGGMMIYDFDTGEANLLGAADLIPEQSTLSVIALPDGNLLCGSSDRAGTGGAVTATEAALYILDWATRKVVWREVILPGCRALNDLILGPDGLVYGLGEGARFFVFDPTARRVVHQEKMDAYGKDAGSQAPRVLALGPDRTIYALFSAAVVRIEPGTFRHSAIARPPKRISAGIAIHDGRLYFSDGGSHICSVALPPR